MQKRKSYNPDFKAKVVLLSLKEEQTIAQIASQHGVHPNQISLWKSHFLKNASAVFVNDNLKNADIKAQHEKETDKLYTEIGKLTTQLSWLKKKSGEKSH